MYKSKDSNLYRNVANLYDLDQRNVTQDDIPFYLDYASEINGDILELACGTGRVTIPLAKAGHNVWGLDLSKEMLDELNKKIESDSQLKQKINLIHGNMTSFDLNHKFSLIFIPFRSFQSLLKVEDQNACLTNVKNHLSQDGYFIIDVFRPYAKLDESWIRPEALDWEIEDESIGNMVRRTHIRREIDIENQIIYPELNYYVVDKEGKERKIVEHLSLKYYYEEQMRSLLIANGFKIVEEIGYYDKRPINEGPELIFICKKG